MSSTGLGSTQTCQNRPHPISHSHQYFNISLTINFLMISLPVLLTNILLGSAIEYNLMLKDRFTVPGMMTSSLPKFGNLSNSNWSCSISLGLCMMITFCLVLFVPLVIVSEYSGFSFILNCIFSRHHLMWRTTVIPGPSDMLLSFWSIICRVREVNSPFLSHLYWGIWLSWGMWTRQNPLPDVQVGHCWVFIFQVVSVVEFIQAENHLSNACLFVPFIQGC